MRAQVREHGFALVQKLTRGPRAAFTRKRKFHSTTRGGERTCLMRAKRFCSLVPVGIIDEIEVGRLSVRFFGSGLVVRIREPLSV